MHFTSKNDTWLEKTVPLPPCYLLDRWTKYAAKEKADDISNTRSQANDLNSFTVWLSNIMKHSLGLSK